MADLPFNSDHITILCTKCKQLWQCSKQNVYGNTEMIHIHKLLQQ